MRGFLAFELDLAGSETWRWNFGWSKVFAFYLGMISACFCWWFTCQLAYFLRQLGWINKLV